MQLTWDVTVLCPLAVSHVTAAPPEAGLVAELTAAWKSTKYTNLNARYTIPPIAVEMLSPINNCAREFLFSRSCKIFLQSGDDRETSFLFQ